MARSTPEWPRVASDSLAAHQGAFSVLWVRLRSYFGNPYGRAGAIIVAGFVLLALAAPLLAPYDPWMNNLRPDGALARLDPPSWRHWLGTTVYGDDVLSQVMLGSRLTLAVGLSTAILIALIGTNVGLVAGYFGGWVDTVLMRVTDIAYAIPFLPFMIVLIGFVENRLLTTVLAMALVFWRTAARVVRAQVLTIKQRQYVSAARGTGAGHLRILYRHILPHVMPLSLLYLVFGAAWAILTESSLSFLGLGDPDALSWGLMLNQAFDSGAIREAWWWVLPPGCCLMLLLVGIFLVGRGFEARVSPGPARGA
jgi:peptide/nickel transport system permease protein